MDPTSMHANAAGDAVGWTKEFYSRSRERWGPSGILPHHRERAASITRLCGPGSKRILELGAGAGGAAAALADLGHSVTAVDIAPPSVVFARELAREPRPGALDVLEVDFFTIQFDGRFDVVAYWNGFGIGTDADQRRLLLRIAHEWLTPGGSLLLDVFFPLPWMRIAGQQKRIETDNAGVFLQTSDFDPIGCRFLDCWSCEGEDRVYAQSIRCYTPADLLLLLEGTGLHIRYAEVDGQAFTPDDTWTEDLSARFTDAWSYLVQLEITKGSPP